MAPTSTPSLGSTSARASSISPRNTLTDATAPHAARTPPVSSNLGDVFAKRGRGQPRADAVSAPR